LSPSRLFHGVLVAGLWALGVGCGEPLAARSAGIPPDPAAPQDEEALAPREITSDAFRTVELRAIPARVSLPEPSSWRAQREGSFVILEHPKTNSHVVLRVWKAARLVRPAECEAEARFLRPKLPRLDPSTLLDHRRIGAPQGYDVHLAVAVDQGSDGVVRGVALAVGAAVGRCYLGAYVTQAEGPNAPARVADRLATMVPGFIETVEIEGAEARATRSGAPDDAP
jgi:hypothetical protein